MWTIVGLGNPEDEYVGTRHNAGRDTVMALAKKNGITTWKEDKKIKSRTAKGEMFGTNAVLVLPDTYMNNSGQAVKQLALSPKALTQLVVVHDELDVPLGKIKISFGSGGGGHNGVLSIQKALKSKNFIRIRIGISPATASGKLRKPNGSETVDFVIGKFKPAEKEKITKAGKQVAQAIELLLTEGLPHAMTHMNAK